MRHKKNIIKLVFVRLGRLRTNNPVENGPIPSWQVRMFLAEDDYFKISILKTKLALLQRFDVALFLIPSNDSSL